MDDAGDTAESNTAESNTAESNELGIELAGRISGPFRAVILDFDGTLSLLRRNWQDVMIPMMVAVLRRTGTVESEQQLTERVEEFVMRLNGRQTIYQMMQLAEEVKTRNGEPLEPLEYKSQYHDLLSQQVDLRTAAIRRDPAEATNYTVPGSRELLETLSAAGLQLYLASGTDLTYVREEVELLRLDDFFEGRIFGALDDYKSFSKAMIIEQIIRDAGIPGEQILGFGDGFVEIEEVKRVGGTAIGVASNEDGRAGVNAWKRRRLLQAGADVIIGDYSCLPDLLPLLRVEA